MTRLGVWLVILGVLNGAAGQAHAQIVLDPIVVAGPGSVIGGLTAS